MKDDRILTSGTKQDKDASILHLENMKRDVDYRILIDGKNYTITKSDKNHIWFCRE